MGFRRRVREKLSTVTLRRNSTVDADATSTKTTPLGRVRTNSSASIPEHLRHTRSIPASLKTLFGGHSRVNTETSTLGHRPSTIGAASTVGGTRGSSLETESPHPGPTPAEEKTEGAGAAVLGKGKEAGAENQGSGQPATAKEAPKPQVYPESKGKFCEGPPEAAHHELTRSIETKPVDPQPVPEESEVVRPVIRSPVRSQPQEAYSYLSASAASGCSAAPYRKTSEGKIKNAPQEERSRRLDTDDKALAPPTGLKMKLKLAWMGLKTKAKL